VKSDDRVFYARAVWATFRSRAGTLRDMSSAEFMIVSRWMDRSMPLPVVLQGIEDFSGVPRRLEAVVDSVERENKRVRAMLALGDETQP